MPIRSVILLSLNLLAISLLPSCAVQYGVANFNAATTNIQKPFVTHNTEKRLTATGSYHYSGQGYNQGYNELVENNDSFLVFLGGERIPIQENFRLYSLGFNRVIVTPTNYYSFGLFGHGGEYKSDFLSIEQQGYNFFGGGISGEYGVISSFGRRTNLKTGIKTIVLYEGGEYADFRKRIDAIDFGNDDDDGNNLNPDNLSMNASVNCDFSFNIKEHIIGTYANLGLGHVGLKIGLGITLGFGVYYSYGRLSAFYGSGHTNYTSQRGAGFTWSLFNK